MSRGNPTIDVHAHFVTPWYLEAAIAAGHRQPDGMPGWPAWSVEDHLRLMDAHGIDQAVLSISSPGVHFGDDRAASALARRVNDFAAAVSADRPDRFRFFGSLPLPAVDAALAELDRCLDDLGAAGIVLETNAGGHHLADPVIAPVLDELERRAAVLFVHPTSPPGWERVAHGLPRPMIEFLVETTRSIAGLVMTGRLTRSTATRVIVPHAGAFLPLLADRLQLFAVGMGLGPADVNDVLGRLWFDLAGTPMPTQAEVLMNVFGPDRLLYGSDYCWTPPAAVAAQVASLDAGWPSDRTGPWRDLVSRNAARLFAADRSAEPA